MLFIVTCKLQVEDERERQQDDVWLFTPEVFVFGNLMIAK